MSVAHAAFPSANGAPHTSLGQRPRKTVTHLPQALKGWPNPSACRAMRIVKPAEWIALSGLGSFVDAIPRALPWAGMDRRVAASEVTTDATSHGEPRFSANGASHTSLGQRPRNIAPHSSPALKGRPTE
jgi:hypothetical protein